MRGARALKIKSKKKKKKKKKIDLRRRNGDVPGIKFWSLFPDPGTREGRGGADRRIEGGESDVISTYYRRTKGGESDGS